MAKNGFLDVGNGHKIYWEDWGNPEALPFIYIHGGPGASVEDSDKLIFNEKNNRVIFFDQRGCGKSTPFAETKNNTTQDLISDIEKLREHLGIEKFHVVGGSWGSTLSLLYAIAHPERVKSLTIWGVYLVRQIETDYVNEGYARFTFPEAWERFISFVPEEHRRNGDSIMRYYAQQMRVDDKKTAKKYADEWSLWEMTLMYLNYDPKKLERKLGEEDSAAVSILETHYFLNKCFIPENYILDNVGKIKHIPCSVIQGRYDFCTPPIGAQDLSKAYGKNLKLTWTFAGHTDSEPENFKEIKKTISKLN